MFVQVIRGHATNPTALHEHWQRWERELAHDAEGYLGATAGVDVNGTFIAMVRFDSEAAARRNGARHAQTRRWKEMLRQLDEGVAVHDCTRTDVWNRGGTDNARIGAVAHRTPPESVTEHPASRPGRR